MTDYFEKQFQEYDEYIETKDGLVPLVCLASLEKREKIECGWSVTTTYLYQGEVVRIDSEVIVEDCVLGSLQSISEL